MTARHNNQHNGHNKWPHPGHCLQGWQQSGWARQVYRPTWKAVPHVLGPDEGPQLLAVDLLPDLREQRGELLNLLLTLACSPQICDGLQGGSQTYQSA